MGGIGRAGTDFAGTAGTLWLSILLNTLFSSPDAAVGDDFGRNAAKAAREINIGVFYGVNFVLRTKQRQPQCELDERGQFPYDSCVPNHTKGAGQNNPAKDLPFEAALQKLEGVVEAMEADDLPLETLLAKYEEGAKLVKVCQEKLGEAELKIQQLEKNAAGDLALKPLSLAEE